VGRPWFAGVASDNVGRLVSGPLSAEGKLKILLLQSKPICVIPDNVVL
jgi:hypothetical protein